MPSSRDQRRERPLAEQHEQWIVHLRGQVVSRRTLLGGAVGTAAGSLLLGSGRWADSAIAATLAGTGAIAGGFVVNGRHLSFGADPATESGPAASSSTSAPATRCRRARRSASCSRTCPSGTASPAR